MKIKYVHLHAFEMFYMVRRRRGRLAQQRGAAKYYTYISGSAERGT
jgi:hypothetical protein